MGLFHEIKTLNTEKNGLHLLSDEELMKIHSILVEMLVYIKIICDRNQIPWGICGGCALGVMRHKGFIPWDEDVDIVITREYFERFKTVFQKENKRNYELICPGEEGYYSHIPRIFNNDTTVKLIQDTGRGKGLYIDIFVLDNTFDNPVMRFLHGIQCDFYLLMISSIVTKLQKNSLIKYGSEKLKRQVRLRSAFGRLFSFKQPEYWIKKAIRCFSKVKDKNSKYVVSATGAGHYFGETYLRKSVCEFEEREFESYMFPVVKDIDYFLTKRYGKDYMDVPPLEKQERHAYISVKLD